MIVRNRLEEVRKNLRYSRRLLRKDSGVSERIIQFIETKPGYTPTFRVALQLCQTLNDPGLFWIEADDQPTALAASA